MNDQKKIIVAGAGLVGMLAAIAFKKRGYSVEVFEGRDDMRINQKGAGKSINLVLTRKGIEPLKNFGLLEKALGITTPVYGRMMHSIDGSLAYQPYGKDKDEKNYSIPRGELNILLINEGEKLGIKIHFKSSLQSIDFSNNMAHFKNSSEPVHFDHFVGADGAGSVTRSQIQKVSPGISKTIPLGTSYKELSMPANQDGSYKMDKNALHIWPRGNHFLMGLPNQDGSFTMTLYHVDAELEALKVPENASEYFKKYYPDVLDLIQDFESQMAMNPSGFLGSLDAFPWIYEDKGILVGDAAHAITPFFGQGMNCGFSDIQYLMNQLAEKSNFAQAFKAYQTHQKLNGDAIRDLALQNFVQMSEKVGEETFLRRKKFENSIQKALPELYRSRYAQVVYTLIPYHIAKANGETNEKILNAVISQFKEPEQMDMEKVREIIKQHQ